jgi:serine/threonine-protein kinase
MPKPILYGRYLLLERIAIGGMAEVYLAVRRDDPSARLYAVKRILPTLAEDGELLQMFLDEARLGVQLDHPGVVPVHELGTHGAGYYIAMEYVPGRDLRALLSRARGLGERVPAPLAAYVGSRVADALDHAHRKRDVRGLPLQVVHRDVSPANVLLGFDGSVRVIDFGIAQAALRGREMIPGRRETRDAVAEPGTRRPSSAGVPVRHVEQRREESARRRQAARVAAGSGIVSQPLRPRWAGSGRAPC